MSHKQALPVSCQAKPEVRIVDIIAKAQLAPPFARQRRCV